MLSKVDRSAYILVSLDNLTHNINVLRSQCPSKNTGVIAVVKASAYGHGSVQLSHHLKNIGVERLAVATIAEGIHLRKHHVKGPIHVFGNVQSFEMPSCLSYNLIPTVCDEKAILGMVKARRNMTTNSDELYGQATGDGPISKSEVPPGSINIKIDTGMSRNGCRPDDLPKLIQICQNHDIHIDAIFTHFADSWGDKAFTKMQLETFLKATEPFMSLGIKRHVANSGAILRGYGTDLDFIRPGISMYGLPPDTADEQFQAFCLKPVGSVKCYPTLVKTLKRGCKVGYGCTYTVEKEECIATFPVGYADGYWRHLSGKGIVIRDKTGERCPVVGRVSMDAITVQVPRDTTLDDSFTLLSADYDPQTSASGIAETVGTIAYEVMTRLSTRFPRFYTATEKHIDLPVIALTPESY